MPKTKPTLDTFPTPKEIGARLRLIRIAYGKVIGWPKELSQAELCRMMGGVQQTAWNNSERGVARVGHNNAVRLKRLTGASLDYILEGETEQMPYALMNEIRAIEQAEQRRRA